jgi:hypothetical protein
VEIRPHTTDDWAMLRRHAVTIAEAANLLAIEGRPIAVPGSRSELPGIDLHPNAIAALVGEEWDSWVALASGLRETSVRVLDAVDARDVDAFVVAGTELDVACENCHSRFWYPGYGDPRPADPSRD